MDINLQDIFPEITDIQIEKLKALEKIFPSINQRLNLVSRKDIDKLFERHILHSLSIALHFKFIDGANIIDIGTGGGFPGIPLAIMFPNCKFDLVDSIGKKINAVKEIAEYLNLSNVNAIKSRAENMPAKYDFVVSRAVTAFPNFVEITKGLFSKKSIDNERAIIYLKGGNFIDELAGMKNYRIINLNENFNSDFFETKKIIYLKR